MRAATQAVLLLHRYLGIIFGLLIVVWCLSGFVMMYVSYPALQEKDRIAALQPITWATCCHVSSETIADDAVIGVFVIEMLGTRPVLRMNDLARGGIIIDLNSGARVGAISSADAAHVAAGFTNTPAEQLTPQQITERDQWTVSGEFNKDRPLYKVALKDAADSVVYVSNTTGQAVQKTTQYERFWNWLGAVPHWLYFTSLRTNGLLWAQVVNISALFGCLVTIAGIYIGIRHTAKARGVGRWSTYRGLKLWHHVPGLIFGVFAFAWLASGLISMNPWGFLEGSAHQEIVRAGDKVGLTREELGNAVAMLAALPAMTDVVSIKGYLMDGHLYYVASTSAGERSRFDHAGQSAPLSENDLQPLAARLGATGSSKFELMTAADEYYFDHHSTPRSWPVYRMILPNEDRTRYYADSTSGDLVSIVSTNQRWYRWLHAGLHRLDFAALLRARPLWDAVVWLLLGGVTALCITGFYLGLRRILILGSKP